MPLVVLEEEASSSYSPEGEGDSGHNRTVYAQNLTPIPQPSLATC